MAKSTDGRTVMVPLARALETCPDGIRASAKGLCRIPVGRGARAEDAVLLSLSTHHRPVVRTTALRSNQILGSLAEYSHYNTNVTMADALASADCLLEEAT